MERRLTYKEIEEFCSSNTLNEILHNNDNTIFKTKKGDLVYYGLSKSQYEASHCSCVNIFASHHTVVANILKKIYGYAERVHLITE